MLLAFKMNWLVPQLFGNSYFVFVSLGLRFEKIWVFRSCEIEILNGLHVEAVLGDGVNKEDKEKEIEWKEEEKGDKEL